MFADVANSVPLGCAAPSNILKLIKPGKTRWWSWYKAFCRVYTLRKSLSLFASDAVYGSEMLLPTDWKLIAGLIEAMGPVADAGYALETSNVAVPYVLRTVVRLLLNLDEPWKKSDVYSGRLPADAEPDADSRTVANEWAAAFREYAGNSPNGFDQYRVLEAYVQCACFDPAEIVRLPKVLGNLDRLVSEKGLFKHAASWANHE